MFVNDFQHYCQKSCLFLFIAKDCGPLAVPLNGSLTGNETTFPNEASFSCDNGFILNGSRTRRCQADGSWSGIQATCQGKIAVQMKTKVLHFFSGLSSSELFIIYFQLSTVVLYLFP